MAAPVLAVPVALVFGVVGWSLAGIAGAAAILGFLAGGFAGRAERRLHAPDPLPQNVVSALCACWVLWGLLTASVSTGEPRGLAVRLVVATAVLCGAWRRIRRLQREPGADRLELAVGLLGEPPLQQLAGAVLWVGAAGLVLFAALGWTGGAALFAIGGGALYSVAGGRVQARARGEREAVRSVANATGRSDPDKVRLQVREWRDDRPHEFEAVVEGWTAPADPRKLAADLKLRGYRVDLAEEGRRLELTRLPEPEELPVRLDYPAEPRPPGWLGLTHAEDGTLTSTTWDMTSTGSDPHAAVVGRTGRGKTGCINTIIYGVLRHDGYVWVADPKGVDFAWLEPHPSARRYPEENAPYAVRHAVKEMNSRRKWLMEHGNGAVKISDVERDDRPPHLLVVLDELLEILVEGPKKKDEQGGAGASPKIQDSGLAIPDDPPRKRVRLVKYVIAFHGKIHKPPPRLRVAVHEGYVNTIPLI